MRWNAINAEICDDTMSIAIHSIRQPRNVQQRRLFSFRPCQPTKKTAALETDAWIFLHSALSIWEPSPISLWPSRKVFKLQLRVLKTFFTHEGAEKSKTSRMPPGCYITMELRSTVPQLSSFFYS
jgi:hypothetical protein